MKINVIKDLKTDTSVSYDLNLNQFVWIIKNNVKPIKTNLRYYGIH